MATLKDTSALHALNEDQYINTIYDKTKDTQKQMLQDNYTLNNGTLDTAKQDVQNQTGTNLNRTYVEAAKQAGIYGGGTGQKMSEGAAQQAALTQGITKQQNVTDLQSKQNQAEIEIDRQRQLLGQQYAAEIKKAQANNDMERAQALYDAAKKEDEQLLAYKKQAAAALAARGDNSLYDSLLNTGDGTAQAETGTTSTERSATTETTETAAASPSWTEVLKHEAELNGIYDAKQESAQQDLLMNYQKQASDLEAQRQAQQRKTDQQLTDAYVDALRKGKNYAEVQTAYGQGSGTAAQAQLARDAEMLRRLTELRGVQTATDAQSGVQAFEQGAAYRKALANSKAGIDSERLAALIKAAEEEEAILAENQAMVGQQYANRGDYSILAKLWGLTPEQLAVLMPPAVSYGGGGGGSSNPKKTTTTVPAIDPNDIWIRNDANNNGWGNYATQQAIINELRTPVKTRSGTK